MGSLKSRWVPVLLGTAFCALLLLSVFGNQGCTSKTPVQSAFVATATPTLPPTIISNLEDGSLKLNSIAYPEGVWYASTWGDPSNKVNSNWVSCGNVGANGSNCAIHLFGALKDDANNQYPSFQLECILSSGYFDASAFHGVKFSYNIPTDDAPIAPVTIAGPGGVTEVICTPFRRFNYVIAATQQDIKGGTCPSNCFDHFGVTLNNTGGVWIAKQYNFYGTAPVLTRSGWGYPSGLSMLTPATLKQSIELQWQVGRNGSLGRYNVDYWIDDVEFF